MPSGNKPLPEPMLTQIYVANVVSLGHNELTSFMYAVVPSVEPALIFTKEPWWQGKIGTDDGLVP